MENKEVKLRKNLTGKTFGRLSVISFHHREWRGKRSLIYYLCKCICNNEKVIVSSSLSKGLTISCGCYRLERVSKSGKLRRTDGRLMSAKQIWKNTYNDGCTFEKFLKLSQKPCHYCSSSPSNKYNIYINRDGKIKNTISEGWANQSWFEYNGLDRIDSDLPHIESNIVTCCKTCNYAKRDLTLDEFRIWAANLSANLTNKKW